PAARPGRMSICSFARAGICTRAASSAAARRILTRTGRRWRRWPACPASADRRSSDMDLQLKGKVVFVAGGSRGIGLGIVETLLKEGARVAMTARGGEALEAERARLAGLHGKDAV